MRHRYFIILVLFFLSLLLLLLLLLLLILSVGWRYLDTPSILLNWCELSNSFVTKLTLIQFNSIHLDMQQNFRTALKITSF